MKYKQLIKNKLCKTPLGNPLTTAQEGNMRILKSCAPAGDTVQVFSGDFDSVYSDSFAKLSADFGVA